MNRFGLVLSSVLGLVACGPKHDYSHSSSGGGDDSSSTTPTVTSSDDACAKTSAHAYVAAQGKAAPGSHEFQVTVDAMAAACRTDHWSADAMACLDKSDNLKDDSNHCEAKFTSEQGRNLEHAFESGKREASEQASQGSTSSTPTTPTAGSPPAGGAQVTAADAQASLEIAKGIIKILGTMPKNYEDYRGDVLQSKDGDTAYNVKNTGFMSADSELIMVKANGNPYYMATYTGTKKLTMSLSAFTGGIMVVTNNDGNFASAADSSATGTFFLTLKGVKVGRFTIDNAKQEGTLILGAF